MSKIKKTIIAILLVALAAFTVAVRANSAGSYFLEEGFYYGVQDGEAYVHGYGGDDRDIVIRELFLSKYYVTSVESGAFFENTTMTALSFYDATALRSIGDGAFGRCTALERVNIPAQIESMGTGVFDSCTALSYVRFHKGAIADIPAQSFYGCSKLSNVVILNELRSIGSLAFANCTALERIELPDSVVSIADNAFDGCSPVIYCSTGSYAHTWAEAHGFSYRLTDVSYVDYLRGDTNGSGTVNVFDASYIQKAIIGTSGYLDYRSMDTDSALFLAADVDSNSVINIFDASLVLRYTSGDSSAAGYGIDTVITLQKEKQ